MSRGPAIGLAGAVALVASLGPAASAGAAVTCNYVDRPDFQPIVGITLSGPGDSATVAVDAGRITVNGAPCSSSELLGEEATTSNTGAIIVQDTSGAGTELRIADPPAFAPGFGDEGDGTPEIEFAIGLGDGEGDVLRLEAAGPDAADRYDLGLFPSFGAVANVNAGVEGGDEDADVLIAGAERVVADGRSLDDVIDGDPGPPYAGPLPVALELFGADGSDSLRGGGLDDLLHGGAGDDLLEGGDGRDVLLGEGEEDVLGGGAGPDRLDGGDDDDVADYREVPPGTRRGIAADLGGGTVDGAGRGDRLVSIEGALGTPLDDVVTGDAALNFIDGGGGADRLLGAGETDALLGSAGRDALDGGGARDVLLAGAGDDRVAGDGGKDIVSAGSGDDRIDTGAGRDLVDAAGGGADVVDCGPGRDGFDADPGDRLRSCEIRFDLDG